MKATSEVKRQKKDRTYIGVVYCGNMIQGCNLFAPRNRVKTEATYQGTLVSVIVRYLSMFAVVD